MKNRKRRKFRNPSKNTIKRMRKIYGLEGDVKPFLVLKRTLDVHGVCGLIKVLFPVMVGCSYMQYREQLIQRGIEMNNK